MTVAWMLGAAIGLAAPATAAAHLKTGLLATNFKAHVGGVLPPAPGISARVLEGDQRLELRVAPRRVVIVLGLIGEPFLRFSPAGVEANLASPTASSTHVVKASDAVTSRPVSWREVSRAHAFVWHENRLRPMPIVPHPSAQPRAVATWSIPLVVDGHRATLMGTEWFAARPTLWPWLTAGALLVAGAGVGTRLLSRRNQRMIASLLVPVAVTALLAAWLGTFLAGRETALTVVFAIVIAGGTAILPLTALAAVRGPAQLGLMALIGAFTSAFALPQLAIFGHGFVLSALPAFVARLCVATALVAGILAATLCIPGVIELLETPRANRR